MRRKTRTTKEHNEPTHDPLRWGQLHPVLYESENTAPRLHSERLFSYRNLQATLRLISNLVDLHCARRLDVGENATVSSPNLTKSHRVDESYIFTLLDSIGLRGPRLDYVKGLANLVLCDQQASQYSNDGNRSGEEDITDD